MKQAIDIEDLLVWAYRTQCVDRMERAMRGATHGPGWGVAGRIWELGTRIDTSGAQLAMLGATAPDDALIVHDAVLALGDMWIERDGGAVMVWEGEEIAGLGWKLRDTARGWMLMKPDARLPELWRDCPVIRSVTTAVLVTHAKVGDRPDIYEVFTRRLGRPALAPYANGKAQPDDTHVVGADDVVRARAVYCVWHAALVALQAELDGLLSGFAVTGPAADESPWECQARRVLEVSVAGKEIGVKPLRRLDKKGLLTR